MRLQRAVESDYAEIAKLANLAYRGPAASGSWNAEGHLIEGQRLTEAQLRKDLTAKPNAHMLVLRDDPKEPVMGTVWLEPKSESDWYLGLLTVRPDLQNRQLGRTLLATAEEFAKQHGASCIQMTVINARYELIAWYERRGYSVTGETEPFPYGDERLGRPLRNDLSFVVLRKYV